MAFYQGWNLDDMRRSGSEFNQSGSLNEQATNRPISSFTPINPTSTPTQFISPQKTLHIADVYDIVEFGEDPAILPPAKPRKGRAQSNKGRAVSVNPLWEYVDEGDLAGQNNGDDFQTTLPKRRKPAATKRANSLKSPANTLSQLWQQDEEQANGLEGNVNEQSGSQLTTPPDSSNKKRKRAVSTKAQHSKPKMGPFKAPTITKPAISRQKEASQEANQTMTITCLGHTTSQDQVKLSQTTMERLKAFRYIPPSVTQQQETTLAGVMQKPQEQVESSGAMNIDSDRALLEDEVNENSFCAYNESLEGNLNNIASQDDCSAQNDQGDHGLCEDDSVSRNEAFFADATWNVQMSSQPQYSSRSEEDHRPATNLIGQQNKISPLPGSNNATQTQGQPPSGSDHLIDMVQWKDTHLLKHLPKNAVETKSALSSSQYDELDSSQMRAMLKLSDKPQSTHLNHESICEQFSEDLSRSLDHLIAQRSSNSELDVPGSDSGTQDDQRGETSSQVLPILKLAHNEPHPDPSRYIQVERSDIDDIDIAAEDVSKNYDLDDYDEGLDDSDLMELMTQPIIPATQLIDRPKIGSNLSQNQPEGCTVENEQNESHTSYSKSTQGQLVTQQSSPAILSPEADDEFPLDDDLEEEMINLAESEAGVVERFQPPASLQHPSEGSSSGEVYDETLQFSPPKPKHTVESPTNTGARHTDKDRAVHSPSSVPEMPVEEDWSYIQSSTEEHTCGSPCSDRRDVPLKEVKEVSPIRSQVMSVHSPAMGRQLSRSQMTTTTVLDDSHEYEPLKPFVRPDFPELIRERSPVAGLFPKTFLRVCFRIAEMLKEGARSHALKEDAVIELFARVTKSSRESGTTRQHFQFADLWHDRPPLPNGLLANFSSTGLADTESKIFQRAGQNGPMMARCFGRLKRDPQNPTGWLLDIINIRTTDWEEIRWTKRIVSAGVVKSEKH